MNLPVRAIAVGLVALGFATLVLEHARAGDDEHFPPVTDPLTLKECGGCHLAFPPAMLPAASWRKLMAGLDDHFGDDASLDADTAAQITRYLVANAGDGGARHSARLLRGLGADAAPLRITELPRWVREHDEVPRREWTSKEVGSKANCAACHADAEKGYFEDD
jgi:hypothetical protein